MRALECAPPRTRPSNLTADVGHDSKQNEEYARVVETLREVRRVARDGAFLGWIPSDGSHWASSGDRVLVVDEVEFFGNSEYVEFRKQHHSVFFKREWVPMMTRFEYTECSLGLV